jgi:hypothetical protein
MANKSPPKKWHKFSGSAFVYSLIPYVRTIPKNLLDPKTIPEKLFFHCQTQ